MAEEELGYPHELILLASTKSMNIIRGQYRTQVKLLANLLRFVLKEESVSIKIQDEEDPTLLILGSLIKRSSSSLKGYITKYRKKLYEFMEDFETTQSEPSYSQFIYLLKEGIFLHIICKEIKKSPLFIKEDISRFSNILDYKENDLRAVFSSIQYWDSQTQDFVPHNIVFEFSSFRDEALREAAIFLSYILAMSYPKSKGELLVVHYVLVRKIIDKFKEVVGREDLGDQVLEDLFKVAITLFLCGYLETLRLPNEERIHYTENVIHLPSIEYSFRKLFNEFASISISHIQLRVPLWVLLAIDLILLAFHWYRDIYLPLELSPIGIALTIPDVPIFLAFAFAITIIVIFRLYKLKNNIIKNLRRGSV